MPTVVSLGSVNVDHVGFPDESWLREASARYDWFPAPGETVTVESVPAAVAERLPTTHLGGKGANQAVAAAAAGADSALVGAVGDDADDHGVLPTLADRGVDTAAVETVDGPTGAAYVLVAADAENHIAVVPGANGRVDAAAVRRHRGTLSAADCLLVQHELPTETVLAALDLLAGTADRPTVVFDPAPAARAAPVLDHPAVDVVTPNESEARALGDALDDFRGTVVETRGERPVRVDGAAVATPPAVDAVDTTGAGDVFCGYLGAALARGDALEAGVREATVAAALSTTAEGVQVAVPDRETVLARLERTG